MRSCIESTRLLSAALSIVVKRSRTGTCRASATRDSVPRLASWPASSLWTVRRPTPLTFASRSWVQPYACRSSMIRVWFIGFILAPPSRQHHVTATPLNRQSAVMAPPPILPRVPVETGPMLRCHYSGNWAPAQGSETTHRQHHRWLDRVAPNMSRLSLPCRTEAAASDADAIFPESVALIVPLANRVYEVSVTFRLRVLRANQELS